MAVNGPSQRFRDHFEGDTARRRRKLDVCALNALEAHLSPIGAVEPAPRQTCTPAHCFNRPKSSCSCARGPMLRFAQPQDSVESLYRERVRKGTVRPAGLATRTVSLPSFVHRPKTWSDHGNQSVRYVTQAHCGSQDATIRWARSGSSRPCGEIFERRLLP